MPGEEDFSSIDKDMDALAATIAERESGGGAGDGTSSATPPAAPSPAAASDSAAPSSTPPAGSTMTQAEWDQLPKAWKREMEAEWKALPETSRKYIHEREKQAYEGISKYKSVADKWDSTLSPYKDYFAQGNLDPHEAFRRLADTHLVLKHGTAEQKKQFAEYLDKEYGLSSLLGVAQAAANNGTPLPPEFEALAREVHGLKSTLTATQQREQAKHLAESQKAVDTFFADPANEFAGEVGNDMARLIKAGLATDLKDAYEQACRLNPVVSSKLIAREAEKLASTKGAPPANLKSSSAPAAPTGKVEETIDDTLQATMQKILDRNS